jgi:hypothetical protein
MYVNNIEKPTRCNNNTFIDLLDQLNIFRANVCPSSGALILRFTACGIVSWCCSRLGSEERQRGASWTFHIIYRHFKRKTNTIFPSLLKRFPYRTTIFTIYPRTSSYLFFLSHLSVAFKWVMAWVFGDIVSWLYSLKHVPYDTNLLSSPSFSVCSIFVTQNSNMFDWVWWILFC